MFDIQESRHDNRCIERTARPRSTPPSSAGTPLETPLEATSSRLAVDLGSASLASVGAQGARPTLGASSLALLLVFSIGICFYALVPLKAGAALVVVFGWVVLPGVIVARRLYGAQPKAWIPALLAGPVWGFALSSTVLLALWVSGIRSVVVLAFAPAAASLFAIPAGWLAGSLSVARFDRRDLIPVLLVFGLVPLVDGRPYARVGEMRPEGRAYRAYFTADFVWAMAEVAEVSKGDVPPHNPFLAGDQLHYYWLANLLSSVEHRATQRSLSSEQILLCNALMLDLVFMAFLYFFVRHFVHSPPVAALACIASVLFSSFEGTQQLFVLWRRGAPLSLVRNLNIDAVSRWVFGGMPIDGLQRLLLYQPHHATAWAVGLWGLLILLQARDCGQIGVNLLAGTLLTISLLLSPFLAAMVGAVVGLHQLLRLTAQRRWRHLVVAGLAGGLPVGVAVLISNGLKYVDRSGGPLVTVGQLNATAAHAAPTVIFLSFGPMLIGAAVGAWLGVRRRASHLAVLGLMTVVSCVFYFFVDVRDHQHVYVGWRSGHLLFIAFAPLVGFAVQELWAGGRPTRVVTAVVAVLLALAAAPMTAIDLYNTQDTSNRDMAPGFRWTVILTPDELEALQWIKVYTPPDALVQIEPNARARETWAYIPAFAERRMAAGLPISMIPLQPYEVASARIRDVYREEDVAKAYSRARELGFQYLFVGTVERTQYPRLEPLLDTAPQWFRPVFRNPSVSIYYVT